MEDTTSFISFLGSVFNNKRASKQRDAQQKALAPNSGRQMALTPPIVLFIRSERIFLLGPNRVNYFGVCLFVIDVTESLLSVIYSPVL